MNHKLRGVKATRTPNLSLDERLAKQLELAAQRHQMVDMLEQPEAPVRTVWRYLQKRRDHLDYAETRARQLPIGSGEIESDPSLTSIQPGLSPQLSVGFSYTISPRFAAVNLDVTDLFSAI